ncbi:MAG: bifunctional folylpolyglutamate synthase/dihydrofolate synthase [Thermoplasmata archaeon]
MSTAVTGSARRTERRPAGARAGNVRAAYRGALSALYARRRFGMRPTLDVARALLAALGDPQRTVPSIHITGSKGKGSVATMAAEILSAHGVRTGLYTSPHLVSYRDRMRIDGEAISQRAIVDGLARIERCAHSLERSGTIDRAPTFFEVTTALAFDWFQRSRVDALVVEVGIGGRWDATNLLASRVGVVTTLELEHTEILGHTLAEIATEKSGIFHPGIHAILGDIPPEGRAVFDAAANRLGIALWHLGEEFRVDERELSAHGQLFRVALPGHDRFEARITLHGDFQPRNAALALAATSRFLGEGPVPFRVVAARRALARTRVPGRLERVADRPATYFDVAHTPESARAIARSLAEIFPFADPAESVIVFGCLRGKDPGAMLELLAPLARSVVLVPIRSERSIAPLDLRPRATGRFPTVVVSPSAPAGLDLARSAAGPEGLVLVIGSDYLVGELLRARTPDAVDEPDLSDPGRPDPPAERR